MMINTEIYEKGVRITFALTALFVFVGSWVYCIFTYGYLFGVGLGWLPSLIVAFLAGLIVGFLWPLAIMVIAVILSITFL